jgi:hypothetical protein
VKPITDPIELKERTVRDYQRNYARAGLHVEPRALEQLAVADLGLADNYEASIPVSAYRPDPERDAAKAAEKELAVEQEAAKVGAEVVTGKMTTRILPVLHAKARPGSKWSFAMGRLARILQRPNIPSRTPWADCEIPHLAQRVHRLQAFIRLDPMRRSEFVGDERNPFYGLSDRDFGRKFRRMIEDICDDSAGRLGPWWVPK